MGTIFIRAGDLQQRRRGHEVFVGLRQDNRRTCSSGLVPSQELYFAYGYDPRYFKKKGWASKTPTQGRGCPPLSSWLAPRQDPPGTAPQTCLHPTRVSTALDDASLLSLAEAISRKIARDRAVMGQGRLLDAVVSQELLATEAVLSPAFHAVAELLSPSRLVHQVPRGVLARIFALVGTGSEVVPLTHACRRWRNIALRTPILWTSLRDHDLTNMLPVFIERSQGTPLDVSVSISSEETHRLKRLSDLQAASSHLRSFEVTIEGSFTDTIKETFSHFHKPAPLLTTLSIRFDPDAKVPSPASGDSGDVFGGLFGREYPMLSTLSLKSLRPWTSPLSETLTTLTLASLFLSANDLYPCLKAVPNLRFLAFLNVISSLSDDYVGTADPISLDRLDTLYIHQPGGPFKHFVHLMTHLLFPRLDLGCILMGECETLDEDFISTLTHPVRLSHRLTRLTLQLDGEPASKFYLHGVQDKSFVISLCLPTASMPQIFSAAGISLGPISIDTSTTTEFILRADGDNQTISADNLTHVFRSFPAIDTLVVTGMPLVNVVSAFASLRDEMQNPILSQLRNLYVRGIGADALALMRYMGQRLEPGLPNPRVVCPASLKESVGSRFGEVEAIEDLGVEGFPRPLTVPEPMQGFLKLNLGWNELDWLMERNRWNWN
ncbi:hypothetical protein EI94DRAFT_1748891 [Lactarius quietus]|nr:hypothetical protein EI94DRAFT_1748891 [Lactarius quietus]